MTGAKAAERAVQAMLGRVGLRLQRVNLHAQPTMDGALARARARGVKVATVIDVGASTGLWSERAIKFFPDARYLLVEAQAAHRRGLEAFVAKHSRARYTLAAAGDHMGEVYFDVTDDPFGGRASATPLDETCVTIPMTTIDALVNQHSLPPPYLLKLDTHGFEAPILIGATATLAHTALIVMECYNFQFAEGQLRFPAMCDHLDHLGFRPIDIADPMYRPGDGAFWQADFVFSPSSNPLFAISTYR